MKTAQYFDDAISNFEDNKKAAAMSYPKRLFAKAAPVPSKMLHNALFGITNHHTARAERVKRVMPLSSGGFLAYEGPEVRQDDGKVFAILGHLTAGYGPLHGATFKPEEFIALLGWSKGKHSLNRLDASLTRLSTANLTFFNSNDEKEWMTGLVHQVDYKIDGKPGYWHVKLSDKLRSEAFEHFSQTTHLNISLLAKLPDGVTSWLYSFIASNACDKPMVLEDLHILAGSGATGKEWGRQVREALDTLEKFGVIVSYTSKRGVVEVRKNPKQPRD